MPNIFKAALVAPALLFCILHAHAQKKQFTIAEATNGMATTLAPKGIKAASWQPGSDRLWYAGRQHDTDVWTVINYGAEGGAATYNVPSGRYPAGVKVGGLPGLKWLDKDDAYFVTNEDIDTQLSARMQYLMGIYGSKAKLEQEMGKPVEQVREENRNRIRAEHGKTIVMGSYAGHKLGWNETISLPDAAENINVGKNKYIAYTIDNNLYLNTADDNVKVTSDTDKNIVNGKTVHREEFGIETGIFFSPKGTYLAYYRMDQRMVNDYPIIRWNTTPAHADLIKYPMAGGTSHQVTLCVYNPATHNTITLNTGEKNKDHYLTCVTWSPDEKYIYLAILNRGQDHLWLNKYDAKTGEKVKTVLEETDSKYVHPTHPLTFVPGHSDEFIWWSNRDGYEHLYLYTADGRLVRKLTEGSWDVNEIAGIDAESHKVIITAAKESPLEKHIYSVGLENGKTIRIDKGAGMHNALCSEDGRYVLDVYNGLGTPRNTCVRKTDGSSTDEIMKAADPLAGYDRPEIRSITIKAADGVTPLYGKLILPAHFDSTRKYPVIVYLYNGPNVQLIHNSFPESGNLWYEYMAQHGYIVFTMDGRGSSNRGMAFEQATFRHLGDAELEDQMKGVDYLQSLPYVDKSRMGIHGWSFGGFMTTNIMLKRPGVFKCAVAGGPVMDWKMYEVMYTERYMDTPGENPDGYESANLLDKVKNLQGKLLLIHGTDDNVVVWQNSIDFLKKCVDEGVQVDYFVYPGYEHNVRGKDRIHLMQKISDYFDLYLKP